MRYRSDGSEYSRAHLERTEPAEFYILQQFTKPGIQLGSLSPPVASLPTIGLCDVFGGSRCLVAESDDFLELIQCTLERDDFFLSLPSPLEGYAKQQWSAVRTLSRREDGSAILRDTDADNGPVAWETFRHVLRKDLWVEFGSEMVVIHHFPVFPVLPIKIWPVFVLLTFRMDWRG